MHTILIANRGLSALKFIMSIRDYYTEAQVRLVAFSTPDDLESDYSYLALASHLIPANNDVYMDADAIVQHCLANNIDAVFPGWGYLSERSDFVKALEANNIVFMGPSSQTIDSLGNKINSMLLAEELEVPLVKWSGAKPLTDEEAVVAAAARVEFPCVLKDADGGGGKGIRIVRAMDEVCPAFNQIVIEMKRAPGEACIFVMELMENCRHIEIQLAGDGRDAMHFYGRDCTTQRRNQKLIEEAPITVAPPDVVKWCEDSAVRMAKHVGYKGLGTAEFLYSPETGKATFLEINPRLQVEHIVTELLLDVNLPVLLYRTTCKGDRLAEILPNGVGAPTRHVMAARLNAEAPDDDFKPSLGSIGTIRIPNIPHSWSYVSVFNGGRILGSVDSQFGHLFTVGNDRNEACRRMSTLIDQSDIVGEVSTTLPFIRQIIKSATFSSNEHTTLWVRSDMFKTGSIVRRNDESVHTGLADMYDRAATFVPGDYRWLFGLFAQGWWKKKLLDADAAQAVANGHRVTATPTVDVNIAHRGTRVDATMVFDEANKGGALLVFQDKWSVAFKVNEVRPNVLALTIAGTQLRLQLQTHDPDFDEFKIRLNHTSLAFNVMRDPNTVYSPFGGKVVRIFEDVVEHGKPIIEIEAMKMVFPVKHPGEGKVEWTIQVGSTLKEGEVIGRVQASANNAGAEKTATFAYGEELPMEIVEPYERASSGSLLKSPPPPKLSPIDYKAMLLEFDWTHLRRIMDDSAWSRASFEGGEITVEGLFDVGTYGCGVLGLELVRETGEALVVIVHHERFNNASFGVKESAAFHQASKRARTLGAPRIYICRTRGACLDYEPKLVEALVVGENDQVFVKPEFAEAWAHRLEYDPATFEVFRIKNAAVDVLDGCAHIAGETALAYNSIPTFTYVTGFAVGIGAYLARLGHRVIQRRAASPLLLTGYSALNGLLGQDVYTSNDELGGPSIMGANGVSHRLVDDDVAAAKELRAWTDLCRGCAVTPSMDAFAAVPASLADLASVVDDGKWFETMPAYARSVFTGRAYVGGKAVAIVAANPVASMSTVPADPGDPTSRQRTQQRAGGVWYPDSSYKTAQTIKDANREGLPLLFWVNWRGFSGGTQDMFDEILKYGSMIVDALTEYRQPVVTYLPPGSELRGGAMVVIGPSINPNIRLWCDPSARIGVLEPSGAYDVKFKKHTKRLPAEQVIKTIELYDRPRDSKALQTVALGELKERLARRLA